MTAAEYHRNVKEAAIALLNHLISYSEWEAYMSLLIKNKENTEDD